jgi:hypothetical protein
MSSPVPHAPRSVARTAIRISSEAQDVAATAPLTAGIPPGAYVRLAGDSLRSVTGGFDPAHLVLDTGEPLEPIAFRVPRPDPTSGVDRAPRQLLLARCPGGADAGRIVTVAGTFHPAGQGAGPSVHPWADVPITFRLEYTAGSPAAADADEGWLPASDWFGFILEPGEAEHLQAFARADGTVAVGLFDRYLNPAGVPAGVETRDEGGRVRVRDVQGREALSSPRPLRSHEGEQLLFGEFHWHTEASGDGARDVAASYRSARDGLFLDFAGAADHFPFDPPPSSRPGGLSLRECAGIVDAFDAPGRFVTLLGIELSWRMGHYNFYWVDRAEQDLFIQAWEARSPGPLAGTAHAPDIAAFYGLPADYFERAHPGRTLVIPHHTNVTSENVYTTNGLPVWTHYHWPRGHYDPRFLRLAEMVQTRGSFESEETDPVWKVRSGAGGGSLRTGLARGFRVGFTGGTDNHCGWPSRQQQGGPVGLTGVYADEFSRAGIFRGLYRRRCYATTGMRIGLDFRLNGAPMGSELSLAPRTERRLSLHVRGTAPLERAEVVSQGTVVHRFAVDGPDLEAYWIDERRTRPTHDFYYYVRVRQVDGHCAWSSPIWGDLALPDDPADGGRSLGGPVAWS